MKNNNSGSSGIITVMVSLLLVPLLSFGTVIMEMGRFVGARQALADAQITASMSVLANYNTYLFERFGILAIDPDGTEDEVYETALRYNSDAEGGNSSKLYNLDSNITYESIYNLSDYTVLKRQVLEYAKYSVPYKYLSKKLNISSLFSKFTEKADEITNFINDLVSATESSMTALDISFYSIGRAEYRAFDIKNFFGEGYNTDHYKPYEIYKDYVKPNKNLDKNGEIPNKGKVPTYGDETNYSGRHTKYIDAIKAKKEFLDTTPDPAPKLDTANAISAGKVTVYESNIRKAAIMKFLETPGNKPTEDNPDGKEINGKYSLNPTKIEYSFTVGWSYSVENATVFEDNSSKTPKTVYIVEAVNQLNLSSSVDSVKCYADLERYADETGIDNNNSNYYLNLYTTSLEKNGKAAAKEALISEINQEILDYNNTIANHNTIIDSAASGYKATLESLKTKLNDYADALDIAAGTNNADGTDKTKGTLEEARDAYQNSVNLEGKDQTGVQVADPESVGSNSSEVQANLNKIIDDFNKKAADARSAAALVDTIIGNINNMPAKDITTYSFDTETGADKVNNGVQIGVYNDDFKNMVSSEFAVVETFFNTKVVDAEGTNASASAEGDTTEEKALNALKGITNAVDQKLKISQIWESFKEIIKILDPIPKTNNSDYCMVLSAYSQSILPKMSEETFYNENDKAYVDALEDAVSLDESLGFIYGSAIEDDDDLPESDSSGFRNETESMFGDNGTASGIYGSADENKSTGIGKLIGVLKSIIETVKGAITTITNLIGSIKSAVANFTKEVYNTILIDTYITQKFPSRMSPVSDATTVPVGTASNSLTGDSYFNGCCVEYCLWGSPSEKENQEKTFWLLFGIRAVINCVQILTTPETMSLVSSCNLFAPLMFIALLYMETNIDMNYLVSLGEKIPFWKSNVHMSSKGILNIVNKLIEFDATTVVVAKSDKGKRYHRSKSCHMLEINPHGVETSTKNISWAIKDGYTPCKVCKPESNAEKEDAANGFVHLDYDNYLYILLLFIGTNTKLQNMADLIQLETRYYEVTELGQTSSDFKISEASTYVRSEVKASYNTMLPMFSLGTSGNSFPELYGLEYVGY